MVDLLARGGEIEEAYKLVNDMHIKPNASVWGAILGACSVHDNVAIGKVAARRLFDLDPGKSVNYVVLAGIYAAAGLWDGAWDTRKLMEVENLQKKQSGHFVLWPMCKSDFNGVKWVLLNLRLSTQVLDLVYVVLQLLDELMVVGSGGRTRGVVGGHYSRNEAA
ncbi:hypothetical protein M8C21_005818 [Ambrosia artemisiifolia]|uniref:Pentatricopeptide repeat-containing protein n=1 Tax=Ambrosia artemisiifolia TaxID=4212 RepID=A0AAD5GPA7_AMBAR|nr:hypothetical protein M8C21_005818 [Ambrosia artemisiifolia]